MITLPHLSIDIQVWNDPLFEEKKMKVYVARLDQIHPLINGNKWFKLKHNLAEASHKQYTTLLTFGGAFSNHIKATAAAGNYFGFRTIGFIRGEEVQPLNSVLSFAKKQGMELHFISRVAYRQKKEADFLAHLKHQFPQAYLIPEGGSNALAVQGCKEIPTLIDIDYQYLLMPVGTGGTLAGVSLGLPEGKKAIGVAVLKGADFLKNDIAELTQKNWDALPSMLWLDYHAGGYAKKNADLEQFIQQFRERQPHIPIEWVYSAKMFWATYQEIANDYFAPNTTIVLLHTGGL